jgi:hypothetical protein
MHFLSPAAVEILMTVTMTRQKWWRVGNGRGGDESEPGPEAKNTCLTKGCSGLRFGI